MLEDLSRYVITLLALVDPVICAVMLMQNCGECSKAQRLGGVTTVVWRTGAILLLSAFPGPRLLASLALSLDSPSTPSASRAAW
ncbi:MAG: hypothetical protein HQ527_00920 [Cyanobacteria bacterium]|nr:hypothetical protein [Cyanobacteria bacterium bin.51]